MSRRNVSLNMQPIKPCSNFIKPYSNFNNYSNSPKKCFLLNGSANAFAPVCCGNTVTQL